MPFVSPVVDGTTLVRNAIQSQGFLTGVTGWQISRDGNAEFNNAIFRGDVFVGDPAAGEIEISSDVPANLVSFYHGSGSVSDVWIGLINPNGDYAYIITVQSATVPPVATLGMGVVNVATGKINEAFQVQSNGTTDELVAIGNNTSVTKNVTILIGGTAGTTLQMGPAQILLDRVTDSRQTLPASSSSVSAPRGLVYDAALSGNPLATSVAGVEAAVVTTPSIVFKNGRAYKFAVRCLIKGTVAAIPTDFRIRDGTGIAGTNRVFNGSYTTTAAAANVPVYFEATLVNNTGSDITQTMTLTIKGTAAGNVSVTDGGSATAQGEFTIIDVGEVSNPTFGPDYSTNNVI